MTKYSKKNFAILGVLFLATIGCKGTKDQEKPSVKSLKCSIEDNKVVGSAFNDYDFDVDMLLTCYTFTGDWTHILPPTFFKQQVMNMKAHAAQDFVFSATDGGSPEFQKGLFLRCALDHQEATTVYCE